jgi:hypothetical protein
MMMKLRLFGFALTASLLALPCSAQAEDESLSFKCTSREAGKTNMYEVFYQNTASIPTLSYGRNKDYSKQIFFDVDGKITDDPKLARSFKRPFEREFEFQNTSEWTANVRGFDWHVYGNGDSQGEPTKFELFLNNDDKMGLLGEFSELYKGRISRGECFLVPNAR